MIKNYINILSLLFVISYIGCAQQKSGTSLTMFEFKEKLKSGKDFVVLDVRTPEELVGPLGKLESAINIPVQVLDQRISELEKYKEKEILVICRTQNRSAVAVDYLNKKGFNSKNVLGGMVEYSKK
jgi:rhodanese-related sulfurtransferase